MRLHIEQLDGYAMLQDAGRGGQRAAALPLGGFADLAAAQVANRLVGNLDAEPCIEVAIGRIRLMVDADVVLAVCGADALVTVAGQAFPQNQSLQMKANTSLDIRFRGSGYGYVSVGGSWSVPIFRGSSSPVQLGHGVLPKRLEKSGLGPILKRGDAIEISVKERSLASCLTWRADPSSVQSSEGSTFSVHPGPEYHLLRRWVEEPFWALAEGRPSFANALWSIGAERNRMGIRLHARAGVPIQAQAAGMMRSGPVLPGVVQLLPDGDLLVLGVDSATMGGYPRVGYLRRTDLDALGSLGEGHLLRLHFVRDSA